MSVLHLRNESRSGGSRRGSRAFRKRKARLIWSIRIAVRSSARKFLAVLSILSIYVSRFLSHYIPASKVCADAVSATLVLIVPLIAFLISTSSCRRSFSFHNHAGALKCTGSLTEPGFRKLSRPRVVNHSHIHMSTLSRRSTLVGTAVHS